MTENIREDIKLILRSAMYLLRRVETRQASQAEIIHVLKKIIKLSKIEEREEEKIEEELEEAEKDLAEGKDPFKILDKIIQKT